jgi:hypothetical protein
VGVYVILPIVHRDGDRQSLVSKELVTQLDIKEIKHLASVVPKLYPSLSYQVLSASRVGNLAWDDGLAPSSVDELCQVDFPSCLIVN